MFTRTGLILMVGVVVGIMGAAQTVWTAENALLSPESVFVGDARSVCSASGDPRPKEVKMCPADCKSPEPDCVDKNCFQNGSKCEDWDDYSWVEDNSCVAGTDKCHLTDCEACYDYEQCQKNPVTACNASNDCSDNHSPCATFTYYAWDDCDEDY
jgi:hypothetical protein